ncbi:DUF2950 family protein [Rhizobium azibense]|nr:DUF2950 family protein [Rhizobium azibense]
MHDRQRWTAVTFIRLAVKAFFAPVSARRQASYGNVIAGFGLVAWPVTNGETGIHTFVVNRNGIDYQADLGGGTEKLASGIERLKPNDNWAVTED